jgi:hypothetical protein
VIFPFGIQLESDPKTSFNGMFSGDLKTAFLQFFLKLSWYMEI